MEFFGFGLPEILLIMVVALIIFGPDKLPEMARTAGRYVRQFRQMSLDVRSEVTKEIGLSEFKSLKDEVTSIRQDFTKELTGVRDELTGTAKELNSVGDDLKSSVKIDKQYFYSYSDDNKTTTGAADGAGQPEIATASSDAPAATEPVNAGNVAASFVANAMKPVETPVVSAAAPPLTLPTAAATETPGPDFNWQAALSNPRRPKAVQPAASAPAESE